MKTNENNLSKYLFISALILFGVLTRFIPGTNNFTAVGAIALFGGAVIGDKRLAFLIPVVIMFFSDLIIGLHSSMIPVYACFSFTVLLGIMIRKNQSVVNIAAGAVASAVVFYLVTNLPFWYQDISLYPLTWDGMKLSYIAALPFFRNQLIANLIFSFALFGVYSFARVRIPALAK